MLCGTAAEFNRHTEEVAILLRRSQAQISLLENGKVEGVPALPHMMIGKKIYRFRRSSVLKWFEKLEVWPIQLLRHDSPPAEQPKGRGKANASKETAVSEGCGRT